MYLLDASVFIQANQNHYSFANFPGFWSWLVRQHRDGIIFSIQKVKEELVAGDETDDVRLWAQSIPASFFIAPTAATQPSFQRVSNLLHDANPPERYPYPAISTFLASADYVLVAQALELGAIVVTHENLPKGPQISRKTIKIPYVCDQLGIEWIDTFKMLTREEARFIEAPFDDP